MAKFVIECPVCGEPINTMAEQIKVEEISCAQCGVRLMVSKAAATYTCPVCDHVNDVAERLASEKIRKDGLASIIKYEGDGDTLVWKHPIEDFNYKDSATQIETCQTAIKDNNYNATAALMDSGDYETAYEALRDLNGYKDSAELQTSIKSDYLTAALNAAAVGDSVYFGAYEQDNNTSNGKEEIEWIVLARENKQVLVISKYALDCQQYNMSYTNVTWEKCSLRTWLNKTFLNAAFTSDEAAMITTTTVTADKNPKYSTSAGNNTQDQVFLLSITEVEKYFSSDNDRMCVPTAYAIAQGAYTSSSYSVGGAATCWWWLRSPGDDRNSAAGVGNGGSVSCLGNYVIYDYVCVRPALWINLGS